MPDIWKPKETFIYEDWADYILCHGKDITPWEQNFTKDVQRQLVARRVLSQRQAEILERIYVEKT